MTPPLSKLKFSSNVELSMSKTEFWRTIMTDLSQATFLAKLELEIMTFKGNVFKVFEAGSRDRTPPMTFLTVRF